MTGKAIVVTGASDSIGAAARRLCEAGENVVVVGRSESKTTAVATELSVDCFVAGFADLSQVRVLVQEFRSRYLHIDVLANNAGA
jgi:short-subunit dehydrogenase